MTTHSASAVETYAAIKPFRVQWRPNLTTGWLLIGERDAIEAADELAQDTIREHSGYCRIVEQKAIHANASHGRWKV